MFDFNLTDLTEINTNAYGNKDIFITRTKYFLFICGSKYGCKLFYINSKLKKIFKQEFDVTLNISPYMVFSKTLSLATNTLYIIYEGFNGCYYNIDLKTEDLDEVVDPGILESVNSYLNDRVNETNCVHSLLIKKYSEFYDGNNEYNIHIGLVNDDHYDLVLQNHSWDIIKYLLGYPESVFYCNKDVKELYPLIPSNRIRLVVK